MCIRLANWPIQRLLAERPELEQSAILLHEPNRGNLARIVACSAPARTAGVKVGMPLAEASAVAEATVHSAAIATSTFCQPHDAQADRTALLELATWCQQFSPFVGLDESDTPECLLLDVTGCGQLFHGEGALAEQVVERFRRRGLFVRVAIADTVGAAWAVAHAARYGTTSARVVPTGSTRQALTPLPISTLRLPDDTIRLLTQLGIVRIGQLERLPRASLSARFGPRLLERWDQALGRQTELIVPHRPPEPIRLDWSFETPAECSDQLKTVLHHLVNLAARELHRRQQGAHRLECRLHAERGEPISVAVELFRPSAAADHLWELVEMQLAHLRLFSGVTAVRLEVPLAVPLECRQPEWFGGSAAGPESLASLVDRLTGRLGETAVVQAQLVADPQPEYAYRYEPCVRVRRWSDGVAGVSPIGSDRPLRMQSAQPVSVMSVVPDGPPIRFRWRGRDYQVAHACGPERIETGWWRSSSVRRDYYCAETTGGSRFWLFRRLSDGAWFLQGTFD